MWYKMTEGKDAWNFKPACRVSYIRSWNWQGVILGVELSAFKGVLDARFYKTDNINKETEVNMHKYKTYYAYLSLC